MKAIALLIAFIVQAHGVFASDAEFSLRIDPDRKISQWEKDRLSQFLRETEAAIPEKIKSQIRRPITILFKSYSDHHHAIQPQCLNDHARSRENQIFGQVVKSWGFGFRENAEIVELNELFLNDIFMGEALSRTYSCGHKNIYKLALATIVHEVGHIFSAQDDLFKGRRFLNLTGFQSSWYWPGYENKNKLLTRSPDPYEFKNPDEAFSVNLEFYALDRDYYCRKPSLYNYFLQTVGPSPAGRPKCRLNTTVSVFDAAKGVRSTADLDPSRIYGIDFFYADPGEEVFSRWGHAMYRIIICDPMRREVSEKCRLDMASHVVIGYRANVKDLKISAKKGLLGGYPSQLFFLTLPSVIHEYTRTERRKLLSLPLKLTDAEKIDFLNRALEQHSGYLGEYRFFSNNCATEAEEFIKSVSRSDSADELSSITPEGLLEDLRDNGLLDANEKGDVLETNTKVLMNAFRIIREASNGRLNEFEDVKQFIKKTTPASRRQLFDQLDGKNIKVVALSFYSIEDEIAVYNQGQLMIEMFGYLYQLSENPDSIDVGREMLESTEKVRNLFDYALSPSSGSNQGYGIGMRSDLIWDPTSQIIRSHQNEDTVEAAKRLIQKLKELAARRAAEAEMIKSNIQYFKP
jgi:hypothetical protein